MSVARGFGLNGKSFYTNVTKPMDVNLNFIVDSTNGNGLGIRSLKSNGYVESVYMHTSSTPATGSPNPALGYALIKFKNNFNVYLGGFSGQVAVLASTNLTSTTAQSPYVITSIGTTTLAQFQAKGLPQGLTPAVGMAFVATATGSLGGTGTLGAPGVPLSTVVTVVGNPNLSLNNASIAANAGAQILVQFAKPTDASTTTLVAGNPPDGTVVGMCFKFDGSSVTIDGL